MPPCHALSAVCSLLGWAVPEVLEKERLTSTVRIPMATLFIVVFDTNNSSLKHLFSLHTAGGGEGAVGRRENNSNWELLQLGKF